MEALPNTVITNAELAYSIGWAEYPLVERARSAAAQGLMQIAELTYLEATETGIAAGRQWLAALGQEVEASAPAKPTPHARYETGVVLDPSAKGEALKRLQQVLTLSKELAESAHAIVDEARSYGASWSEIGRTVGTTQQAAYTRFSEQGREAHRRREQRRFRKASTESIEPDDADA